MTSGLGVATPVDFWFGVATPVDFWFGVATPIDFWFGVAIPCYYTVGARLFLGHVDAGKFVDAAIAAEAAEEGWRLEAATRGLGG